MKTLDYILLGLLAFCMHSADASTLRIDFGGFTFTDSNPNPGAPPVITGSYEGYFLIDSSVEPDNNFIDVSIYRQSLIAGSLTINGVVHSLYGGPVERVEVRDGTILSSNDDRYGILASIVSDTGEFNFVSMVLVDSSGEIFDNTDMPSMLTQESFDPYSNFGGSYGWVGTSPDFITELMTIEYAYLRPVPLPASIVFFASALLGLVGHKRLLIRSV